MDPQLDINQAPELSVDDVRDALNKRFASARWEDPNRRPRTLLAYYGRGNVASADVPEVGNFEVISIRSELDLRAHLPALAGDPQLAVFLLPWTGELPLDIRGRFAANGKILRIGKDSRICRMFGVAESEGLAQSPLANYLAQLPPKADLRTPSGHLTESTMWRSWLSGVWGLEVRDGLAADALLAWAAFNGRGGQFVEAMQHPAAAEVRDALLTYLKRELGEAAEYVWGAWEQGNGRTILEWSLLYESLANSEDVAIRIFAKQSAMQQFEITDETRALAVARQLGQWAGGAVRFAETRLNIAKIDMRAVMTAADQRATTSEIRQALTGSPRLPSGWSGRVARLGTALLTGARNPQEPTLEHLRAAVSALDALAGHDFYRDAERRPLVEKAEMATRLLAWLASNPLAALEAPLSPVGDIDLLGRWYTEEGGHVDRARHAARAPGEGPFGAGAQAVLASCDALRLQLDRRFAGALTPWYAHHRQGTDALPIDKAIEQVAVRFMKEGLERKVLILLMDGMGWAQAVELFESMAEMTLPWGPIAWHTGAGSLGEGVAPVVLANLPTLTDVSRAGFFAGKPLPHGHKPGTDKDPARFRDHTALRPLFTGARAPKLMLRGEGHGKEGNLSSAARELVRDSSQPIAGIVVNAIDASLKADSQQRHRWAVEDVKSLPELLDVARESGRAVLFCSDHGHVPADIMQNVGQHPGGSRWRPWTNPDDTIEDYEVGLSGPAVWTPKGAHGVALLADDTTLYGGVSHAGEHGGASLAEVMVPCLLLGCEDGMADLNEQPALQVRGVSVPGWWHYEIHSPVEEVAPTAPPTARPKPKRKKTQAEHSLPLPGLEQTLAEVSPPEPLPVSSQLSPLAANPLLLDRTADKALRAKVITTLQCLHAKGGSCSDAVLAGELDETPWRIGGFLSKVEEVMNVEGYQVIRYDRSAKQVHLSSGLLLQIFEVKL